MKTQKIVVNKTPEQPAGVEIDIVVPDGPLEERMLAFLLELYLRQLKHENRVNYDIPRRIDVEYRTEGRFVAKAYIDDAQYYEPPRPFALVGLRAAENRFDLIHAPLNPPMIQATRTDLPSPGPQSTPPQPPGAQGPAPPQTTTNPDGSS